MNLPFHYCRKALLLPRNFPIFSLLTVTSVFENDQVFEMVIFFAHVQSLSAFHIVYTRLVCKHPDISIN